MNDSHHESTKDGSEQTTARNGTTGPQCRNRVRQTSDRTYRTLTTGEIEVALSSQLCGSIRRQVRDDVAEAMRDQVGGVRDVRNSLAIACL